MAKKSSLIDKFSVGFARYIKAITLAVAALPVALAWTDVMPTLSANFKAIVSVMVTIFCYLIITLVYHSRLALRRIYFWQQLELVKPPRIWIALVALAPWAMSALSLFCFWRYAQAFNENSLYKLQVQGRAPAPPDVIASDILNWALPYYFLAFALPVAALSLMFTREYLQETEKISDDMIARNLPRNPAALPPVTSPPPGSSPPAHG